jgi:colicin import membrane protein
MRAGLTISAIGHAAVLAWGLITFAVNPLEANHAESLPVDIISSSEFTKIMAGQENAKQAPVPKPLVEKVAEAKPVENPATKVTERKEIAPTAEKQAPPVPEPKPVEKKPEPPKEQAKAEPKPAEKPKKAEPKPDPIAEALKKDEAKKPPRKPAQEQPKFDPNKIAALLDKRSPQRQAAAGEALNSTASLGLATGRAAELSQDELAILRAQLERCWAPPAGVADARDLKVDVRIVLNQDGSLAAEPRVTNRLAHPLFTVAADSALRAVRRCQPLKTPPVAKYERWKEIEITFDPRDMFRG